MVLHYNLSLAHGLIFRMEIVIGSVVIYGRKGADYKKRVSERLEDG